MAKFIELEDMLNEAIRLCCQTDEDKEAAKKYFENYLVNDLIDTALEE